jgi:hypothetical protein
MKTQTMLATVMFVTFSLYSGMNWAHGGGGHGGGGHGGGGHGGGGHGWGGGHGGYHGHGGFGFYFGAPYYTNPYSYYGYPYYPYYSSPPVVTVPESPPVYIQQQDPEPDQQDASAYWHYCTNPEGYYPYVKECPGGWQLVEPTPPPR